MVVYRHMSGVVLKSLSFVTVQQFLLNKVGSIESYLLREHSNGPSGVNDVERAHPTTLATWV